MGCGCGKKKSANSFVVTFADGSTKTFQSQHAANAAVRRAGGNATVKQVAKT